MDSASRGISRAFRTTTYRITIRGLFSENWAEWFNDGQISIKQCGSDDPQTCLICIVRDQAELLGILNRLNSLNLQLLQVMIAKEKGENNV